MKVNILLALLSGFIFSCSVSKEFVSGDLIDSFYGVSNGSMSNTSIQYSLELKTDNVFKLKMQRHGYQPECVGIWEHKNDTIFLKCNEEKDIAIMLSSGYMNQREYKVVVKNRNKLKLNNVVLRKNNNNQKNLSIR